MAGLQEFDWIARGGVTAPRAFRAGAVCAGIKDGSSRLDLAVVAADEPCVAHGLFTRSRVVAAPVVVSRARLREGRAQGIVLNSGNGNACTGASGLDAARAMADETAAHLGIEPELMLVASTGVIGVPLPVQRVRVAMPKLQFSTLGGHDAARAILTTDRVPKEAALRGPVGGREIAIGGMAKGSGMLHPSMATFLGVLTTDAAVDLAVARWALKHAADRSFNQVTVDRDTSTNDTLVLFASGAAGGPTIRRGTRDAARFSGLLEAVCVELAQMIARDGEGATRLVEVSVEGARTSSEARRVAREVVASNLVKAAIYGSDPNWGRILMAVGNAGVPIDADRVDVYIGHSQVAKDGAFYPFDRDAVIAAMGRDEVPIRVCLNQGRGVRKAWGCDLTEDYVKINAEYTT